MISDELKQDLVNGTQEYIKMDTRVTIEFSIKKCDIDQVFTFINDNTILELPDFSFWMAYDCETCQEYHGSEYVHLSIEHIRNQYVQYDKGLKYSIDIEEAKLKYNKIN